MSLQASFEIAERIRLTLNMTAADWADQLGMRESEYRRDAQRPGALVSDRSLQSMAAYLGLAPETIADETIDFAALAAHHGGFPMELPERYAVGAFSKRRTSVHMLDFIEQRYGWRARQAVVRRFQLNESIFADPSEPISLRFQMDLCQTLYQRGHSDRALLEMGTQSVVSNFRTPLAEEYRHAATPWGVYEACFEELAPRYYDRNFKYRIVKLTQQECIVESYSGEEASQALKIKDLGNVGVCQARMGTFASITGYLGLPYAAVEEIECVHRGGSVCRVRIDYSAAASTMSMQAPIAPGLLV